MLKNSIKFLCQGSLSISNSRTSPIFLALLAIVLTQSAHASTRIDQACGNPFKNHFGPFDYRDAKEADRKLVEGAHFTLGVETLTQPKTDVRFGGDVAYTLHVFPNHHRALQTMARLSERTQKDPPFGARYTVDCYFQRAIEFRPNDNVARLLYARHLGKDRRKEALAQLAEAARRASDNPFSHYNIGLVYAELNEYELALIQAHRAADLGMPRQELRKLLEEKGAWREPASAPAPSTPLPANSTSQ